MGVDNVWATVQEAAVILRVSEVTVRTLARNGQLKAIRVGRQWRIDRNALLSA